MKLLTILLAVGPGEPGPAPDEAVAGPAEESAPDLAATVSVGETDPDFGPFYEGEPASEVQVPSAPRDDRPFLSVGGGAFCFVEASKCRASLLAAGDIAAGLNVISGEGGFDIPTTQFRILGGIAVRPFYLARKQWHPWGLGAVVDWSQASGPVAAGEADEAGNVSADESRHRIRSLRITILNQIWLGRKRHSFHVDIRLGAVQSSVLVFPGRYWGTTAEVALGFGGWGAVFVGGDFLDRDTRVLVGLRLHGIAAGPLAGLAVAGYAAGGGFRGGGS